MTWSYWFMSAVSPEAFVETVNQLSSPVFSLVAMLDQLQFTHLIVVVAIHVGSLLLFWNRIRDRPIHRYILYNILLPEMSLDLSNYFYNRRWQNYPLMLCPEFTLKRCVTDQNSFCKFCCPTKNGGPHVFSFLICAFVFELWPQT